MKKIRKYLGAAMFGPGIVLVAAGVAVAYGFGAASRLLEAYAAATAEMRE